MNGGNAGSAYSGRHIRSVFGEAAPLAAVTLYIASTFVMSGFTRGLSHGPTSVTVSCIQPGSIDTEPAPPRGTPGHDANVGLTSVGRYGKTEPKQALFCANRKLPSSMVKTSTSTPAGTLAR